MQSTIEKDFILSALENEIRVDGRGLNDVRQIQFEFRRNQAFSQCEVQLGKTRVLSVVTASVTKPFIDRPNEGIINFYSEFSPMASEAYEIGRPSDFAIEISRIVERGFTESRAIDKEALCIVSGESVWTIRCENHLIDDDGNITDAIMLAANAALLHFRLPEVTKQLSDDNTVKVKVHSYEESEPSSLSIHHNPLSLTFGFLGNEDTVIIDPSSREELVMQGQMTIMVNLHGEVCGIYKSGGPALEMEKIFSCTQLSRSQVITVGDLLKEALHKADLAATKSMMLRARKLTGSWTGADIAAKQIALPSATVIPLVKGNITNGLENLTVKDEAITSKDVQTSTSTTTSTTTTADSGVKQLASMFMGKSDDDDDAMNLEIGPGSLDVSGSIHATGGMEVESDDDEEVEITLSSAFSGVPKGVVPASVRNAQKPCIDSSITELSQAVKPRKKPKKTMKSKKKKGSNR